MVMAKRLLNRGETFSRRKLLCSENREKNEKKKKKKERNHKSSVGDQVILHAPTPVCLQFCPSQSFSIRNNMAFILAWKQVGSVLRNFLALEERMLYNLYARQYLPGYALSGNVVSSIESTECLQTERHTDDGYLLMAVPKKRTTVHKRKLRNRHKQLKNRTDIEICAVCGNYKVEGQLCGYCVERIKKETKEFRKEKNEDSIQWPVPEFLKKFRT